MVRPLIWMTCGSENAGSLAGCRRVVKTSNIIRELKAFDISRHVRKHVTSGKRQRSNITCSRPTGPYNYQLKAFRCNRETDFFGRGCVQEGVTMNGGPTSQEFTGCTKQSYRQKSQELPEVFQGGTLGAGQMIFLKQPQNIKPRDARIRARACQEDPGTATNTF